MNEKLVNVKDIKDLRHLVDVEIGFHCHEQAGTSYSPTERERYQITEGGNLDSVITSLRLSLDQEITLSTNNETCRIGDLGWNDYGFTLKSLFTQKLDEKDNRENLTFQGILTAINLRAESMKILSKIRKNPERNSALVRIGTTEARFYDEHLLFGLLIYPWTLISNFEPSNENRIFVHNLIEIQRRLQEQIEAERLGDRADTLTAMLLGIREIDANGLGENVALSTNIDLTEMETLINIVRQKFSKQGLTPQAKTIETFRNACGRVIAKFRRLGFLDKDITENLGFETRYNRKIAYEILQKLSEKYIENLDEIGQIIIGNKGRIRLNTKESEIYSIIGVEEVELSLSNEKNVQFILKFKNGHKFGSELDRELLVNTSWVENFNHAFQTSEQATILIATIVLATVLDIPLNKKIIRNGLNNINGFVGHNEIKRVDTENFDNRDLVDQLGEVYHSLNYVRIGQILMYLSDNIVYGESKSELTNLLIVILQNIIPDRNKSYSKSYEKNLFELLQGLH